MNAHDTASAPEPPAEHPRLTDPPEHPRATGAVTPLPGHGAIVDRPPAATQPVTLTPPPGPLPVAGEPVDLTAPPDAPDAAPPPVVTPPPETAAPTTTVPPAPAPTTTTAPPATAATPAVVSPPPAPGAAPSARTLPRRPGGSRRGGSAVADAPAAAPRRPWWERFAAWQSRMLGNAVEWSVVRTGGHSTVVGESATAEGLRVCREGRLKLHAKGGTTFGDVFVCDVDPARLRTGLIAHETHHRDAQWRRYGWVFGFMYLWAHLLDVVVRHKCCNRYELAAERASGGGGGYRCLGKD